MKAFGRSKVVGGRALSSSLAEPRHDMPNRAGAWLGRPPRPDAHLRVPARQLWVMNTDVALGLADT